MIKNIFIIGSKGIPAKYGGFETFVEKLTEQKQDDKIQYHVSCMSDNTEEFTHNQSHCFNVKVPNIGSAKAVYYDYASLNACLNYIETNRIKDAVVYILACRIGPFLHLFKSKLQKLGVKLYVNPDGNEWKRSKWNRWIRMYWKLSERLMIKHADLLICDSVGIEQYIINEYKKYNPSTVYISYGADVDRSILSDHDRSVIDWMTKHGVKSKEYYLVVGRFVPENNYETMIKEFMQSSTKKDFVIITNIEKNKFYEELQGRTRFDTDKRIKFVGTVYDQELLKKIREEAHAYLHGHEVGGTNPSLLEALASTELNLLLDVIFNREVGSDGALYFSKSEGSLARLIERSEGLDEQHIRELSERAKNIIRNKFAWSKIVRDYEQLFVKGYQNKVIQIPAQLNEGRDFNNREMKA